MYTFTERVLVHPSVHPPKIGVYFSDHAAKEALGACCENTIRDQRRSILAKREKSAIIPFGCSFDGNALNTKGRREAFDSCKRIARVTLNVTPVSINAINNDKYHRCVCVTSSYVIFLFFPKIGKYLLPSCYVSKQLCRSISRG